MFDRPRTRHAGRFESEPGCVLIPEGLDGRTSVAQVPRAQALCLNRFSREEWPFQVGSTREATWLGIARARWQALVVV